MGGAIGAQGLPNAPVIVVINSSNLNNNTASGGDYGNGSSQPDLQIGTGGSGAVGLIAASATITNSVLTQNSARGGDHAIGGSGDLYTLDLGVGVAIAIQGGSTLTLTASTLTENLAAGGNHSFGDSSAGLADIGAGLGGAIFDGLGSQAMVSKVRFSANRATGGDDDGGNATGNTALAGAGGASGQGGLGDGGLWKRTTPLKSTSATRSSSKTVHWPGQGKTEMACRRRRCLRWIHRRD